MSVEQMKILRHIITLSLQEPSRGSLDYPADEQFSAYENPKMDRQCE